MRKIIVMFVFVLVLATVFVAPTFAQTEAPVCAEGFTSFTVLPHPNSQVTAWGLLARPSEDSDFVGATTLAFGQTVCAQTRDNQDWMYVQSGNTFGWIRSTALVAVEPLDLYGTEEQAALGSGIIGVRGVSEAARNLFTAFAIDTETMESFDPTLWVDAPMALGFWWYESTVEPWNRQEGNEWFTIAEVENAIRDEDNDFVFELYDEDEVYTAHALEFSNFTGIGIEEGMLYVPNPIRILVQELEDTQPNTIGFCVRRNMTESVSQDAWETLSEGTGVVTLQIGSLSGVNVVAEIGEQTAGYNVQGTYADLAVVNTALKGEIAEFEFEHGDYSFGDGAELPTSDVLTFFVPEDGTEACFTLFAFQPAENEGDPLVSIWFGSGTRINQ